MRQKALRAGACHEGECCCKYFVKYEDADKYFTSVAVEKIAIPENAYTSTSDLPKEGFYIEDAMTKAQMVLKDNLASKDQVMDKYKGGYEITSFAAESFDDSVNDSLRKGDIVDVYAVDPASEIACTYGRKCICQ